MNNLYINIQKWLILFLLVAYFNANSQVSNCTSPEARQFDFWIGKWDIQQDILKADGSWLTLNAVTEVTPVWDGCGLSETWRGEVQFFWEGMTKADTLYGYSFRYYDAKKSKWVLQWMDSRNPGANVFEGYFENGTGLFYRYDSAGQKPNVTRIKFSDITDKSIRWELAVSSSKENSWQTLWIMKMFRSKRKLQILFYN